VADDCRLGVDVTFGAGVLVELARFTRRPWFGAVRVDSAYGFTVISGDVVALLGVTEDLFVEFVLVAVLGIADLG
jgi:hypothetical protein